MKSEHIRTAMALGEDGIKRLADSNIIIFGLGGVGSYVFEALCRVGVGRLTLVDGDTVSLSNINRQLCALHSTVGMNKTDVLAARAKDINPDCRVKVTSEFLTADNADLFFAEKYDFCIDAIDDTRAKTVIAVKCAEKNIPLIASMGTGNKLRPDLFKITDISKTEYCPLCKKNAPTLPRSGREKSDRSVFDRAAARNHVRDSDGGSVGQTSSGKCQFCSGRGGTDDSGACCAASCL